MIAFTTTARLDTDAPNPADLDVSDIATCLSRLFRWRGAIPITVAEHSVVMAQHASSARVARCCLVHDMPEAFIGDIPSPLRAWSPEYEEAEARIMHALAYRFGLPLPFPAEVRRLDLRARRSEVEQYLPDAMETVRWLRPLPVTFEGWSPARARREFLRGCREHGLA
jgi:hypothetical protein